MSSTKIARPEALTYTPPTAKTTRADLIRLAGARLASKATVAFAKATADWHPDLGPASPKVPLFTLPNKLLTRLATFFTGDATIKKVARDLDRGELSSDELAQILRPLQERLAESGWSSVAFISRPTTTRTPSEESDHVQVDRTDGHVSIAIGADAEALANLHPDNFAFVAGKPAEVER